MENVNAFATLCLNMYFFLYLLYYIENYFLSILVTHALKIYCIIQKEKD
jgi:hypothetical protein